MKIVNNPNMKTVKDKKLVVGADFAGYPLKEVVCAHLRKQGWEIEDLGVKNPEDNGPENMFHRVGLRVGSRISEGEFERALIFCGTGMGIHIAASKCPHVHVAVCESVPSALRCICGNSKDATVSESHINGCDGEILMWAPWTSTSTVPTTSGTYYLLKDVTTTKQSVIGAGNNVKVDLNGKNITLKVTASTYDGFRLYRADRDASLTLTDTTGKPGTLKTVMPGEDAVYPGTTTNTAKSEKDENGKIINRVYYTEDEMRQIWAAANSGMLLWVRGGEISVHNGIYDGSALTGAKNGMTVYVGNVTETDAETGAKTTYYGTFNLYGGTIVGGYTEANGNIAVIAGATMNIYGGTVKDGRSYKGGNLYVEGTLNMQGGTVSGGKVDRSKENVDGGQGGNIWLDTKAVMNLSGGTVKNGFVRGGKNGGGQGGNIFVGGVLNGTGGTISGGDATAGGNIGTISADSAITLKKVKVLDGQADAGGNILIGVRSNKALELMEGTVISGGHARSAEKGGNGGNIAVNLSSNVRDQEQVILIDGATITGGTSVGTGGNIRIRNLSEDKFDENGNQTHRRVNVKIVMRGGTISGGKNDSANRTDSTRQNGGSVYQSEYSQFILEGGTVTGGDCSDGGGNFYLTENSTLELRGGSITGGLRNGEGHAASNIFVVGGTLKLSGGKVDGNVAVSGSSDVILSGKAVVSKGSHGGITLRNGNLISIDGTLAAGSEVYTSGAGYVSKTVAAGNEAYIHSVDGYPSNHVDGRIFYGKVSCLCSSTNHTEGCKAAMAALGLGENDKLPMLPVTAASDMADGGYWYLPKSITSGANVYIPDNKPLVLDLNGNTLTADHNSFLFSTQKAENGALLVVTDTEGEGGVTLTSSKDTTAQGGILRVSGKSGKDVCYVLGGRLDASGYRLTTGKLGGVVAYVTNGCTLKQYGGTFVGRDSGTAIGAGSTVHVKQGAYELLGGAVEGGTAKNGGNVYVDTAASFTMSGGSITGGKADEGSNLYILGTATLRGGELSGVYVGSDSVTVTGNATVAKGSTYGLKVENGKTVNVTGLTGTVSVTGTAGRAFARGGSAAQAETNLRSELGGSPVMFYEADYLYLGKAVDIYCVCGATLHGHKCQDNGTLHRWSDWTATDTLPSESGYYRLTDTVNVDGSKTATLTGQTIYLDLNGQTVNLENGENLYNFTEAAGAKLIITDSSEKATGIAKLTGTNSANGGFADILAGNTVELYRATLDASQFSTKENGAALAVRGTFHMHSGAVVGGKAVETKKNGGTLWLAKGSQLTLDGGTVTGGEAGRWGGAIYVTGSGTLFTMNGGTVTGGKAAENGGVIIVRDNAVMNMKNGTITGSNLFVDGTGVFTMTGGSVADMEVNGNKATVTGGATVAAMTINSGKVVDMKGLTGTVTVISQPGQVFAAGTAEQINVNILSQVTVQGFKLPILVKDTDQLYLDAAEAVHCICGASLHGHKCQDDGKLYYWQPWTETSTLPSASGYYRLTGTVNVSSVVTLANGETIYLDLNGQKVNLEDKENLYSITEGKNVRVVVTDSSKDATGAVKLTGSDTANGGIAEILTGNTLEVYRATFDASGFTLENNGTVFSVKGGTCVIHSGKLIGGKAQNGKNQKNGGTLWVVTGAQVTMKDGTIVGGYADKWAGAVYASDANTLFKLEGGTIEGGSAQMLGGNVVARNGATFHMTGGTVTGGSVVTGGEGANVYVYGDANNKNQGTFKMEGGTVTGGVYVSNAKEVTITGSAIIDASLTKAPYTAPAYGLKVENGRTVNVAGLTGKVCVSAEPGTCFATGATAAQANVNVLSETRLDDTDLKVLFVDGGKLHMGTVYCICGASLHGHKCQDDGTKYLWTDWTAADTLPSDSGYYRLTGTVNVSGTVTLANGETIYLDLNGQTVNLENGENLYTFTANKNVRVVVTDSSKNATGTVKLTGTHTANGGITEVTAGNTLELYRATLDASTFTTAQNGGTLAVRGELIIHSGTLKGGTVRGLNSEAKKKNGGTLWVSGGKVTMHDGLIIGGNADNMAGAIYLAGTAQFLMENGTITGGYGANGGGHSPIPGHNIQINSADAIMRITGGTITGGVHLNKIKEVTITNGAIIDKSLTDSAYTMPEHSLSINKAYSVNVADLTGTVYVTATEDAVFATGATAAQAEKNVLSEVTGTKVVLTDSTKLKLTAN